MSEQILVNKDTMEGLSIEDLLDIQFSEIEEVADFIQYPKGIWLFDVKQPKTEEIGSGDKKTSALVIELIPQEIVDLKSEDDRAEAEKILEAKQPLKMTYPVGYGIQELRTRWEGVNAELNLPSLRDFVDGVAGTMIRGEVRHRFSKPDPETKERRIYTKLVEISVAS